MPLHVPYSNAFFIDGDSPRPHRYLIDTGFSSPGSIDLLSDGIKEAGGDIKDVGTILLTHGHRDHMGLADEIREMTGAKALLNRADFGILNRHSFPDYLDRVTDFYKDMGVRNERLEFHLNFVKHATQTEKVDEFVPDGEISEGDEFVTGAGKVTVIEMPGHTDGSVSFLLEDANILFTGDLVSAIYDPPPLVMVEREGSGWINSYDKYMNSLKRLKDINPVILAPGHGAPMSRWADIVKKIDSTHKGLSEKIAAILKEKSEVKVGLLTEMLYPKVEGPLLTLSLNLIRGILIKMEREGRVSISGDYLVSQ